jgi:acetylornithine deacetylase
MSDLTTVQLLKLLVGHPTVSKDSNLELIGLVSDYLAAHGVDSQLIYNSERTKANLFATIGPADRSGIILSGHTDVVPVGGQDWSTDPFLLTEKDGKLHGRGTADMKGFIASVLASVPLFLKHPLKHPVHIALSYDEEVGCLGIRSLLSELTTREHKAKLCLIGEPTEMRPVLGHKGKLAMRCQVKGAACHSAYAPSGVNAIEYAARLIGRLGDIGADLARPEHQDERFDPPFSTVQVGLIKGGRALNIVPAECNFDFEVRALPGFDAQSVPDGLLRYAETELLPKMHAIKADCSIELSPLGEYPGLATSDKSEAADLIALLSLSSDFGMVAFGTEGGLFNRVGIPTVVCGPGSMDQGHKPDEYVSIAQLEQCDAMLARLAHHLQSSN